jgi:kynurenine formamidase
MRFVEISHRIEPGMTTYPGLPVPRADVLLDYETSRARYDGKSEFLIASLHLCGNTGTYVDAPIHRFRGRASLAELPLDRLAHLPIAIVDGVEAPRDLDVRGRAVLFRTGWSRWFGTERYASGAPFLTAATCERLVSGGAALVGIDSINVDDVRDGARPAHTILLGAGIPVCEHLTNLENVPASGRLHAVPIAWHGGASFPVRAYVIVED